MAAGKGHQMGGSGWETEVPGGMTFGRVCWGEEAAGGALKLKGGSPRCLSQPARPLSAQHSQCKSSKTKAGSTRKRPTVHLSTPRSARSQRSLPAQPARPDSAGTTPHRARMQKGQQHTRIRPARPRVELLRALFPAHRALQCGNADRCGARRPW